MKRFLLDANLSPRNSEFLRDTFGFDAIDLITLGLTQLSDREVAEMAIREERIVITEDLDFGKLYHHYERAQFGVIVIRLRTQSSSAVNRVLNRFFSDPRNEKIPLDRSVVILDEWRVRVSSEP